MIEQIAHALALLAMDKHDDAPPPPRRDDTPGYLRETTKHLEPEQTNG